MNTVSITENGTEVTLCLSGRIDSANATQTQEEILRLLQRQHTRVTADLQQLSYISSAGLRVLLRLCKKEPTLSLINVTPEVYEILSMTGFTEILEVKRAYRQISIDGCKVIGNGAMGTVYRLDDDIIVKVFKDFVKLPDIHRERELARKAFIWGVPTAIPFDVVKVGDRFGSIFELLKAKSMAELIAASPDDTDGYIDRSVELMRRLHATTVERSELPAKKPTAISVAAYLSDYLPQQQAEKFTALVQALPDRPTVIHGDLHIKNMMIQNGELLLIDMDTLSYGDPVFEFAALFNAYNGYSELDKNNTLDFFGIEYDIAQDILYKTLHRYLGTDDEAVLSAAEDKARLLGYAMLYREYRSECGTEPPQGEEKRRLDAYMGHILTLLDRVDSLSFPV